MDETDGLRRFRRWQVDIPIFIEAEDQTHYCSVYDISPGGARVRPLQGDELPVGTRVSLDLEFFGHVEAEVRHQAGGIVGLRFLHDASREAALSTWLVDTRPERRQIRYSCAIPSRIVAGARKHACTVVNLSRSGAGATSDEAGRLVAGSDVVMELPGYGTMAATVRHIQGAMVGLSLIDGYDGPLPPAGSGEQA